MEEDASRKTAHLPNAVQWVCARLELGRSAIMLILQESGALASAFSDAINKTRDRPRRMSKVDALRFPRVRLS